MFGSSWNHHLKIEKTDSNPTQGSDGSYSSGGGNKVAIYDDKCDAQEPTGKGLTIQSGSGKGLTIQSGSGKVGSEGSDLEIYLKDETKINDLKIDMKGTLTRGSRIDTIKITNIRLIDGMIEANTF